MNVAVGFDQRGVPLRPGVIVELMSYGHAVVEVGSCPGTGRDYVATAHDVAAAILAGKAERGVVISRSGVGASFVANKIDGIRAGAPTDLFSALHALDDGMNLLCLGVGALNECEAVEIIATFVAAETTVPPARRDRRYAGSAATAARERAGSDQKV